MKGSSNILVKLAIALVLVSGLAAQTVPLTAPNLPSEATVDSFLKQMFGWNQDLTWKIADIKPAEASGFAEATAIFNTPQGQQVFRIYITPDQKFAMTGDMIPFGADPFAAAREALKAANGPSHGPADAALTIVEFGDLECPACKAAQPHITKLLQEEPKVKLIFQNFPLESVHKWALLGAKYLDCIAQDNNDAAIKFIATVYEHQGEITPDTAEASLKSYAKEVGANPDAIATCAAKPDTASRIKKSIALGDKMGVSSTPTFFINGRKVVGLGNTTPYDVVKAIVDFALAPPPAK